jgi:hypothetical protein
MPELKSQGDCGSYVTCGSEWKNDGESFKGRVLSIKNPAFWDLRGEKNVAQNETREWCNAGSNNNRYVAA